MAQHNGAVNQKVGDFIVRRLRDWGVERVYGFAGDGVNGIIGGIQRAGNRPRLIQPPHEELAALMACAHARYTGQVGVCLGTSGPGAIHLLNGLYDAAMDHQPLVAIVGQRSQMAIGSHYQQDVDLQNLFKDVPPFPYAGYADMLGLTGIRVDAPDQVAAAWDRALSANRPVVYDDVPTLPPELTPEHRKNLAQALAKGDSEADGVPRQLELEGYPALE